MGGPRHWLRGVISGGLCASRFIAWVRKHGFVPAVYRIVAGVLVLAFAAKSRVRYKRSNTGVPSKAAWAGCSCQRDASATNSVLFSNSLIVGPHASWHITGPGLVWLAKGGFAFRQATKHA